MAFWFLSCIILLFQTEVDLDSMEPKPTLLPDTVNWCKSVGGNCTTVQEAIDDSKVLAVSTGCCILESTTRFW